jgi:solute carrier family 35 protein E1
VNKKVLNALPLPWLVGVAQLAVGAAYAAAGWGLGLRDSPRDAGLDGDDLRALWPIAAAHGIGQVATVVSLSAGAVSFCHIVKALEPFFSAIGTPPGVSRGVTTFRACPAPDSHSSH